MLDVVTRLLVMSDHNELNGKRALSCGCSIQQCLHSIMRLNNHNSLHLDNICMTSYPCYFLNKNGGMRLARQDMYSQRQYSLRYSLHIIRADSPLWLHMPYAQYLVLSLSLILHWPLTAKLRWPHCGWPWQSSSLILWRSLDTVLYYHKSQHKYSAHYKITGPHSLALVTTHNYSAQLPSGTVHIIIMGRVGPVMLGRILLSTYQIIVFFHWIYMSVLYSNTRFNGLIEPPIYL